MKKRVTYAGWGMVLVGILSALMVVLSAGGKPPTSLATTSATNPTPTTRSSATPPSAGQASPSPQGANVTPTATSAPTVAASTPSPTPLNQGVDLHGSVSSIDQANNTFVLVHYGTTYTILVTSTTTWSGTASSLGQLQSGWHAVVHGRPSGGMVVAADVDANPNTDN